MDEDFGGFGEQQRRFGGYHFNVLVQLHDLLDAGEREKLVTGFNDFDLFHVLNNFGEEVL